MKWMALFPLVFLTACGFYNSENLDYKEVIVTPPPQESMTAVEEEAVDVTITEIKHV